MEYPGIREDVPRLRLFPDSSREYRITDHLASVRATLDGTGAITKTYEYKPFGGLFMGSGEARQSFNSREKDQETGTYNNGVRKLDDDEGRFTSIDPLWERFRAWSPYQYGYNNPLGVTDPTGMQASVVRVNQTAESQIGQGEGVGDAGRTPTEEEKKATQMSTTLQNIREAGEMAAFDYADGTQSHPAMEAWKAMIGLSLVKRDSRLLKLAEETFKGNDVLRKEANALIDQLHKGNMNPGKGSKHIGHGIHEARSQNGARVYFRNTSNGIEILGYSSKDNQKQVIERLFQIYK